MSGFKEPSFADRQKAAREARQDILDKFRAKPGPDDPQVKQRMAEREAQAAARAKAREVREAAKAEQKAREAEAAAAATALLALVLPIALIAWVGGGMGPSEHFRRMFRVRVYVLAMSVRVLLLLQLLAGLTLLAKYCVALRDYPRETTGWILAAAWLSAASSC